MRTAADLTPYSHKKYKTTWPQCPVSLMCTYSNVTLCLNIDHNSPQRFTFKHQCRISDCNLICVKWSVSSCSTFENIENIWTLDTRSLHQETYLGYYFLAGTRNFLKSLLVILQLLPHTNDPTPNRLLRACSHVLVCSQIANVIKSSTYKIYFSFTVYWWTDNIWLWNDPVIVTAASPAWVTGVNVNMTPAACPTRMKCDLVQGSV